MNIEIYQTIRDRILYLDYAPGQILNETHLAEEFDVSRTPIRDVLSRLEWEQLVKILPRTGTIVTEIDFQKTFHVFQIRTEIEGLTAQWACDNINDIQLGELEKLNKELMQFKDPITNRILVQTDRKFRQILYDASNNAILSQISQYLYNLTIRLSAHRKSTRDLEMQWNLIVDEIDDLYKIFSENNSSEAKKIRRKFLRKHIEIVKNRL